MNIIRWQFEILILMYAKVPIGKLPGVKTNDKLPRQRISPENKFIGTQPCASTSIM